MKKKDLNTLMKAYSLSSKIAEFTIEISKCEAIHPATRKEIIHSAQDLMLYIHAAHEECFENNPALKLEAPSSCVRDGHPASE